MITFDFETNAEVNEIINKSLNKQLLIEVLEFTNSKCKENNLIIKGYTWQSLVNHISAMVDRGYSKEYLQDIDELLFNEISQDSILLAEKIVSKIEGLPNNEKFLLSVHFEVAK